MKIYTKLTAIAAASTLAMASQTAWAATSADANASATIVTPIAITTTTNLDFGTVSPSSTLGTVVIANNGTRTKTGGAVLVTGGSSSQAVLSVSGQSGLTYDITLPTSVSLSDGGAHSMTVDTFTTDLKTDGTQSLADGGDTMNVGATLHVAADQAAGSYTNTFTVLVAYN
jgi:hypothetical protein